MGYLDGDCEDNSNHGNLTPMLSGKYPHRLIDTIVDSISAVAPEQDDNIQLQVIQVMLTIVTSFICKVHDKSLSEIFRCLYFIHISTKNSVNYATSKAALNQMVHITCQRMELSYVFLSIKFSGRIVKHHTVCQLCLIRKTIRV